MRPSHNRPPSRSDSISALSSSRRRRGEETARYPYWRFGLVSAVAAGGLAIWLLWPGGWGGSSRASRSGEESAAELIESGNSALAQGDFELALADFTSAVGAQPDSAQALERRATAFVRMKKFDQALSDCNSAIKIDGKFPAAYFTRGLAEKNLGDQAKAIEDFTKALDNGLERVDVLTERGELYRALAVPSAEPDAAAKLRQKALKDFDRAVNLAPRQPRPHQLRAELQLEMGDYESATADCDAALEADPNLAEAHLARARAECELGEIDHAITDCDSALHLDENLIEAYVIRAKARLDKAAEMRSLAEVAECRQAVADCGRGIDLSKKVKDDAERMKHAKSVRGLAHELRGLLYQNLGASTKALTEYNQALALDPSLVSTLLRRAVTRSYSGDFAGAMNDCNTAIAIDSTRPEAYSGRGTIYTMKPDFPKAIDDFTNAVSLNSKCAKAYAGRAIAFFEMSNAETEKATKTTSREAVVSCQEKAKELLQKCIDDATAAIAANHHLARAYLTRGLAYAHQNVLDKALGDFNEAIRDDPRLAQAYYNRAVLKFKQGQVDAAIKDFEECMKLEPNEYLCDVQLSKCYAKKGDVILNHQYYRSAEAKKKEAIRQQLSLEESTDFMFRPKKEAETRPDVDAEPLAKAKKELEQLLDATADK